MLKRLCLLSFLAVTFFGDAKAGDTFAVTGVGQFSCGHWLENKPTRPIGEYASADNILGVMDTQWVLGFLSAFNRYGDGSGNVMQGTDNSGIYAWIDNYCAAHPLDSIVKAAMALVEERKASQ
jgi:hypothetical protein